MANYRITSEGTPRVTSEGRLRAIDTPFEELSGSTGLAIGLAAQLVGSLVLAGNTALAHEVSSPGLSIVTPISGSTQMGFSLAAANRATAVLDGTSGLQWALGSDLGGSAALDGAAGWTWSLEGFPSAITPVTGEVLFSLQLAPTSEMGNLQSIEGITDLVFGVPAATLEQFASLDGSTLAPAFGATAEMVGNASLTGTTNHLFSGVVDLQGKASLDTTTGLLFQMSGAMSLRKNIVGLANLTFGTAATSFRSRTALTGTTRLNWTAASGAMTKVYGSVLRDKFLEVYRTREILLNKISEHTRGLANDALTQVEAVNTAVTSLSTRVTATESSLTSQADQITQLQTKVTAKASIFAQPTAPPAEGRVNGDTWIDTDDGNKLYTWASGSWQLRALDAGIQVFAQATAPSSTGRKVGDMWYDTDDQNRPYRWDGFSWAAVEDGRVVGVVNATNTLSTRVDVHDGKFTNLEAKWNVTLDVNGYISGVESINNGSQATFTVRADIFRIVSPGQAAVVPFQVVNGVTYIKDAMIEKLSIGKLSNGSLNADMNIGTGRIIFDNGVVMQVQGIGFGSQNQFIEWFGPRQTTGGVVDLSKCTEALATSYKKTNGDAYHGGSLSAGVLTNAAQSTQFSTTATVETGNFGSNGGPRTVVFSLAYNNGGNSNTNAGSGPTGATVTLQRSVNNGAWVTLTSFQATGEKTAEWDTEMGWYAINVTCGGSATYTDNSGGTGPINYRAVISNASGSWPWYNQVGNLGSQSLSVRSTEQ